VNRIVTARAPRRRLCIARRKDSEDSALAVGFFICDWIGSDFPPRNAPQFRLEDAHADFALFKMGNPKPLAERARGNVAKME
jgi:hypothetical protein